MKKSKTRVLKDFGFFILLLLLVVLAWGVLEVVAVGQGSAGNKSKKDFLAGIGPNEIRHVVTADDDGKSVDVFFTLKFNDATKQAGTFLAKTDKPASIHCFERTVIEFLNDNTKLSWTFADLQVPIRNTNKTPVVVLTETNLYAEIEIHFKNVPTN